MDGVTSFPAGFFDRADPTRDGDFYAAPRFVTHIDDDAITAVGALYEELGVTGTVLDVMASWVSHFRSPPDRLVGVGLNAEELAANPLLADHATVDLNATPRLPFPDDAFDDAVCCVSIDYLVRPVEVVAEVGRVVRPGGRFVVTVSNRCFPTKAVRGWLAADDAGRVEIVRRYLSSSGAFGRASAELRTAPGRGDPLYAIWATVLDGPAGPGAGELP